MTRQPNHYSVERLCAGKLHAVMFNNRVYCGEFSDPSSARKKARQLAARDFDRYSIIFDSHFSHPIYQEILHHDND